jgi:hypothetical protein
MLLGLTLAGLARQIPENAAFLEQAVTTLREALVSGQSCADYELVEEISEALASLHMGIAGPVARTVALEHVVLAQACVAHGYLSAVYSTRVCQSGTAMERVVQASSVAAAPARLDHGPTPKCARLELDAGVLVKAPSALPDNVLVLVVYASKDGRRLYGATFSATESQFTSVACVDIADSAMAAFLCGPLNCGRAAPDVDTLLAPLLTKLGMVPKPPVVIPVAPAASGNNTLQLPTSLSSDPVAVADSLSTEQCPAVEPRLPHLVVVASPALLALPLESAVLFQRPFASFARDFSVALLFHRLSPPDGFDLRFFFGLQTYCQTLFLDRLSANCLRWWRRQQRLEARKTRVELSLHKVLAAMQELQPMFSRSPLAL